MLPSNLLISLRHMKRNYLTWHSDHLSFKLCGQLEVDFKKEEEEETCIFSIKI